MIELNVQHGTDAHLDVSEVELAKRRAAWTPAPTRRGDGNKLYVDHVQQAHLGLISMCSSRQRV